MKTTMTILASVSVFALAGCETYPWQTADTTASIDAAEATVTEEVETVEMTAVEPVEQATETVDMPSAEEKLQAILAAQPDEVQARYDARHPAETLAFFGIEPGMKVMEALPGGGWYTKILMPYIGSEGAIVGAHYPDEIWVKIIPNADEERIAGFVERTATWGDTAKEWVGEDGPEVGSYQMTKLPEDKADKVDAALFIRALHNLHRTEASDHYMSKTIAETYRIVKPGGIVGVVQHRAPESNSDEWADGNAGYLKQSLVIAAFEDAGFIFKGSSEINANANDLPSEEDIVWRLPPTRAGADTEEKRAVVDAIGESDRMTLKFVKPKLATQAVMQKTAYEAETEATMVQAEAALVEAKAAKGEAEVAMKKAEKAMDAAEQLAEDAAEATE